MSKGGWKKRGVVHIVVDVESDGRPPGDRSMVCFAAVVANGAIGTKNEQNFYGKMRPISPRFDQKALAVSGFTRKEHETFENPEEVMIKFKDWLDDVCDGRRPVFWSDNNSYDFAFIDYYFLVFLGENPFGYSSRRIGDLYCGVVNSLRANREWKNKYRKTKHTHDPLDDARGNAEALMAIFKIMDKKRDADVVQR